MNRVLVTLISFTLLSCQSTNSLKNKSQVFDADELKPLIQKLSLQWNVGLEARDINTFRDLDVKKAHYLPKEDAAIHGNENIANYWQAAFGFVSDLKLNLLTLEGSEYLLYETGEGTVKVMDESGKKQLQKFKYVNVWKKQHDGSYKVVIDTFNKGKIVILR